MAGSRAAGVARRRVHPPDDEAAERAPPASANAPPVGPPAPSVPRYGESSLADLTPSLLAALGAPALPNVLHLEPLERVCLFVVDGLGWELLLEHRRQAPFLASLLPRARALTAGFPASTVTSVTSLGTGAPPGEHGMTGYTMAIATHPYPLNCLTWGPYRPGPHFDLRLQVVPEELQPLPTLFERVSGGGIECTLVTYASHEGSGLTRASLRGATFQGIGSLLRADGSPDDSALAVVGRALRRGRRSLVYTYHPDLDAIGHRSGVRTEAWRRSLRQVDRVAQRLADELPPGALLAVTGDHGTVDLAADDRIDVADRPELTSGVRFLAGDARARHVHVREGAADDVLAAWREVLGRAMWVVAQEEAIAAGWFGPRVLDHVRPRIGDIVAAAFAPIGVFQRAVDPLLSELVGHHGSMTSAEQLVPYLSFPRD